MFNKKFTKLTSIVLSILMITSILAFSIVKVSATGVNVLKQMVATTTINGWSLSQGSWYFFTNGTKVTNTWKQDSSKKWFYLGAEGAMVINKWAQDSSKKWFYLGSNGAMLINKWEQDSSKKWFYLGSEGAMVTSTWVTWNSKQYYLNTNGDMAENTTTPDGYVVDGNGAWTGAKGLIFTWSTVKDKLRNAGIGTNLKETTYTDQNGISEVAFEYNASPIDEILYSVFSINSIRSGKSPNMDFAIFSMGIYSKEPVEIAEANAAIATLCEIVYPGKGKEFNAITDTAEKRYVTKGNMQTDLPKVLFFGGRRIFET